MTQANPTWPDSFDFRTDSICQDVFAPFIAEEQRLLAEFDTHREQAAPGMSYIFHEHNARVGSRVFHVAKQLGLTDGTAENLKQASLLHDVGKRLMGLDTWIEQKEKPVDALKERRRTHTVLGAQHLKDSFNTHHDAVQQHPFLGLAIDTALHHHEQIDGKGALGKSAKDLSAPARLVAIVEAHDGYTISRPHFQEDRDTSAMGALQHMKNKLGHFDPELLAAFEAVISHEATLEKPQT